MWGLPITFRVQLAAEFRKAQIFCCPSTWSEPFGMVNVEAMATALPVIATAVGGIPEIFQEGGGLLIPSNSPGALAAAIELLLKDSPSAVNCRRKDIGHFKNATAGRRFTLNIGDSSTICAVRRENPRAVQERKPG